MYRPRFFYLLCCGSLIFTLTIYILPQNIPIRSQSNFYDLTQEALENAAKDPRFAEVYRKQSKLPKNLKYILLLTPPEFEPFPSFGVGQRTFLTNNCSRINCYVTTDVNFFGGDVTKFHAIMFNGRNIAYMHKDYVKQLHESRSVTQKYIYVNGEAPGNYPVCDDGFDGFFNWTATFKLDSDIFLPYFFIKDVNGVVIGPKTDIKWIENKSDDNDYLDVIINKTKAAAWFVSNCNSKSEREKYVSELQKYLRAYGYSIDIYGRCGTLECPRDLSELCNKKLEKEYYFYLAFENSLDVDYVSEKFVTALQHKTVPIVYGGANYSRFAPPGSYIDARRYTPSELAVEIARLISNKKLYTKFFAWNKSYSFHLATDDFVCDVCDALNNKSLMNKTTILTNFRKWWNNPQYDSCFSWWPKWLHVK